jgi:hypothetical protein
MRCVTCARSRRRRAAVVPSRRETAVSTAEYASGIQWGSRVRGGGRPGDRGERVEDLLQGHVAVAEDGTSRPASALRGEQVPGRDVADVDQVEPVSTYAGIRGSGSRRSSVPSAWA